MEAQNARPKRSLAGTLERRAHLCVVHRRLQPPLVELLSDPSHQRARAARGLPRGVAAPWGRHGRCEGGQGATEAGARGPTRGAGAQGRRGQACGAAQSAANVRQAPRAAALGSAQTAGKPPERARPRPRTCAEAAAAGRNQAAHGADRGAQLKRVGRAAGARTARRGAAGRGAVLA